MFERDEADILRGGHQDGREAGGQVDVDPRKRLNLNHS